MRFLVAVHYAHAEKLVLVWDNLNIHAISSLYKAFPPAEARRIAEKLEIHHTLGSCFVVECFVQDVLKSNCVGMITSDFHAVTKRCWEC